VLCQSQVNAPLGIWIDPDMAWVAPQYSKAEVDAAGKVLAKRNSSNPWDPFDAELLEALTIINNWRSAHNFPLNTFQIGLRRRAKQSDPNSLVAQRIKRLPAIRHKLRIMGKWVPLSEMQDIGGCRAVVGNPGHVYSLVENYNESDIKHKLERMSDYIKTPKPTGYRGIHLIYRYNSDRNKTYNGMQIEVQLRSPLQHAWATAVETVGLFTRQALKSSRGEKEWLRFFALMGSALALRERLPIIPNTPEDGKELTRELRECAAQLDVVNHLHAFSQALQITEQPGRGKAHYFLVELDPVAKKVKILGYTQHQLSQANTAYVEAERAGSKSGIDAVLVSVESLSALKRAYPNYFLDTGLFIKAVEQAIARYRIVVSPPKVSDLN
jgi:ppGpp synthetase/RelA/SpoT-type nucleotidyltranferase